MCGKLAQRSPAQLSEAQPSGWAEPDLVLYGHITHWGVIKRKRGVAPHDHTPSDWGKVRFCTKCTDYPKITRYTLFVTLPHSTTPTFGAKWDLSKIHCISGINHMESMWGLHALDHTPVWGKMKFTCNTSFFRHFHLPASQILTNSKRFTKLPCLH